MTPFSLLCSACGLSKREAAEFLRVRPDTALSWSSGRRTPSDDVLKELAALARAIERAASEAICDIRASGSHHIELGFCTDDAEAQSLGLPFASCHGAILAQVIAASILDGRSVMLVPRGSTPASALAADAHNR